ncbi:MAG: tyrosine-protein phosphatase [Eggerthellaceae bacterium]|nr:tyrosine-protein phosphatase [Eggerthellaceae bacterium]
MTTAKDAEEPLGNPELPEPIPGFPDFGHISLRGLHNTRDLGGMPAADGRRIARRRLIRSGALHHATDEDLTQLTAMHDLERVVDFRTDLERDKEPDPKAKLPGVVFYDLPVFQESAVGITHEGGLAGDMKTLKQFNGDPFDVIRDLYPESLLGEDGMRAYADFLQVLLGAPSGATLWHCTEGKDRAGMGAILVEYALGVPVDYIRADYLATNLFVRTWAEKVLDLMARHHVLEGIDADVDALFYAQMEYYRAAFDAVRKEFGTVDNYLADGLGFGPDAVAELRARYLE